MLGATLRLPIDCIYLTRSTKIYPTTSDSIFSTKKLQKAHNLKRNYMKLKTYYNNCAYGLTYVEGKKLCMVLQLIRNWEALKQILFYKEPYKIVEVMFNVNFRVQHDEAWKSSKVQ